MRYVITILLLLASILFPSSITAKDFSRNASLVILKSIVLGEHKKMDFGVIEEPTEDVMVHVNTYGFVGDENTAKHLDTRTVRAGKYRIFSTEFSTISMNAYNGGSVEGMTFKKINAY